MIATPTKPTRSAQSGFGTVNASNPCRHCGKSDWCYRIGDFDVCKRQSPAALGWEATSKTDKEGTPYYAPIREKKAPRPKQTRHWEYLAFDENGELTQKVRVTRIDDGSGKKKIWQEHWNGTKWIKGLGDIKRNQIVIYRYQEIKDAIAAGQPIFIVEGEPCADALWELGLAATTNIGGAGKSFPDLEEFSNAQLIVLCPDRDKPGIDHMLTIGKQLEESGCEHLIKWLLPFPDSATWHDLPLSGGVDVLDWIADYKLGAEEIINAVIDREAFEGKFNHQFSEEEFSKADGEKPPKDIIEPKPTRKEIKSFCQKMYAELFAEENYIYVFKQIHKWMGTHYEPMDNAEIIKQIHDYCDTYQVLKVKENKETGEEEKFITYPYADPQYVNKAFEWIKQKFGINPNLVNPPGLNCVDGVLQLSYDPDSQRWMRTLIPHDPSLYYLYAPQASYEIPALALPDACDQLLSCLDAPQREIFLKTIASAFDMPTVRRYRGREVRGLLLHGLGNNGKDTLREVTAMMFGYRGMVGATLSDFQQYDQGRKFPLQKLDGALINWPSENADCMMLDRIQSLKIAITGDPLAGEKKGKDEYQFRPRCPNLFNVNMPPKLQGAMEAIKSRFAILKFLKTFKSNPGPGELQADPRFLYDPEFVRTEVLPWYLHYCLEALDRLMIEGINYDVTDEAWEDLREESDHIYAFCREVGIGYKHNGVLYADEVYERLRQYYIDNGALEIDEFPDGRKKDRWSQNPAWGDSLVKGLNLIFPRLLKIFPQARRERNSQGRNILVGIGWIAPSPVDPNAANYDGRTINVEANPASEENVADGYTSEDVLNLSEDGLNVFNASQNGHSERAEDVLADCRENKKNQIRVATSVVESARNLSNAWLKCKTAAEVKELTAQHEDLKPQAWKLLTEDGRNHLRQLMVEGEGLESENSKKESPPPKHVQDVQNSSTTGVTTPSEDIQPPSEHVQKSIEEIQNEIVEDWQLGEQVTVETDIASLKDFNGRTGEIEAVKEETAQCLVRFSEAEMMHIPFRSLRRQK
jgi:putative DNA primase/helicase